MNKANKLNQEYVYLNVLRILDYALERPDELIEVARENSGCGLRKISDKLSKSIVREKDERYGITKEETLSNATLENAKAKQIGGKKHEDI